MNKWIISPKSNDEVKIRLFCFPYAGSSAVVTYRFLSEALPKSIEVCPVEFPGRGGRMAESLISDLNLVIDQLYSEIIGYLDKPFSFFGHSMGALVAYELGLKLQAELRLKPSKLYLSAHRAPQLKREGKLMHLLSSSEFVNELKEMNGIAEEIFEHQELLELMLPIIKNDYQLCETYKFNNSAKLDIPFQIYGGTSDKDVDLESLNAWELLTKRETKVDLIEGDHFFLTKEKDNFLKIFKPQIESDLQPYG